MGHGIPYSVLIAVYIECITVVEVKLDLCREIADSPRRNPK